jgi:hypothetical protein
MALLPSNESISRQAANLHDQVSTPARRPLPKAICILLPVWGTDFIGKFLEQSLPTLLAPGNIPALAKALPSRFVFLTREREEGFIRAHPACVQLQNVCAVEFLPIDDLITSGNHSTTITLAYARAVRLADRAMLDTCFFFLVSDYVVADGSLAAVLARIQAGASAVQAGNFQLDEETAEDWLLDRLAGAETSLALKPREIMRWALGCLHRLTAANIINYPLCHNTHANRLLWRVDPDTLIGRFYLLHMICIRPEIADFVVGSSCDYSFVPEMCPSGSIEVMTDSDEYLVVEVQPTYHEANFLRLGPMPLESLARGLSEWTTARHRANAEHTLIFHAGPLPARLPDALGNLDDFIAKLTPRLAALPQPHRNHPYWLGAIAAFDAAVAHRDAGMFSASKQSILHTIRRIQLSLLGKAPYVTRLHPRWRDYERPLAACKGAAIGTSSLLIGASRSTPLTDWLRRETRDNLSLSLFRLTRERPGRVATRATFDFAFVEFLDNEIGSAEVILQRVIPLMRPNSQVTIFAINQSWFNNPQNFADLFASGLGSLACLQVWPEEFCIVSSSRRRWWINEAAVAAAKKVFTYPTIFLPLYVAAAAMLFPIMAIANLASSWLPNRFTQKRIVSSVFIRLRVSGSIEGVAPLAAAGASQDPQ